MMRDPYTHKIKQIERLNQEWLDYGSLIIALDFDNCIFDYHDIGWEFPRVIALTEKLARMGCEIILFTASDPSRFPEIEAYMETNRIPYHGINVDSNRVPFRGRKIYYNALLDDRAGLGEMVDVLEKVSFYMEGQIRKKVSLLVDTSGPVRLDECCYSGKPFNEGEWVFTNTVPSAFKDQRSPNDIIPCIEDIMKLFKK